MTPEENCILCFNKFEEKSIPNCSPKLRELCYKYLDLPFTEETSLRKPNGGEKPFCSKCYDFMEELNELNDQLECYQKRISELVFIRSLEIMYRRGKHPVHAKGSSEQKKSNYRKSQRQLIEFDVSEFPNCEFKKTCSDITESIETSTEDFHNFSSPSPAVSCEDDEELQNSLDTSSCAAKVKDEIDEFDSSDENDDSFIDKSKSNSDVSVGDNNRNKTQNPILKLQKLVLSDSGEEIILMGHKQSNTGNNKRRRELQTTWTKRNCGSYKLTAANKVNTSDNVYENLESGHNSDSDEQISMKEASVTNSSSPRSKQDDGLKLINNETFQCVLCDEEFPTKDELEVHKVVHSEEHAEKSDADENKSNSKDHLLKHKRINTNETPYKCDLCQKAFSWKHYFLSHMIEIHQQGSWPFNCDFCGKGFHNQNDMKKHRRVHTGERPYSCEFCGKRYKQISQMSFHIKNHHTGEKPYECEVCGKTFIQKGLLITHCRIHTGERPYHCKICGKNFVEKKRLVSHGKIHSGEKPHKCEVCGKGFISEPGLRVHASVHTEEKPFNCEICGKGFTQAFNLKAHKSTHSGEKPHKCDVCGRRFVQAYHLKIHKRSHTEEKPFNCEVCGRGFTRKNNMLIHKCHRRANKKRT